MKRGMEVASGIAGNRYHRACADWCCDPSGIGMNYVSIPGVSPAPGGLNPRLISATPSGVETVHFVPDI
jgi:hypothetical protein